MNGVRNRARFVRFPAPLFSALAVGLTLFVSASSAIAYTISGRTDYVTGSGAIAAATADIDWDGDIDLAVVNYGAATVTVRLNDGTGVFGAPVDFGVGAGPYDVALADMNGDGRADLLTANALENTFSVFLNDGAGSFLPKVDYPCLGAPTGIGVADLNADSFADVVVATFDEAKFKVYLNNGSGGFSTSIAYPAAPGTENVALGDLDGDGALDVVACNYDGASITVRLNDGAGAFGVRTDFSMGAGPFTVALGDVNTDGKLDVVTANYFDSSITIRHGNGSGGFAARHEVSVPGGTTWLKLVDVNLDGRLDAVTSDFDVATATVLLGDGNGDFTIDGSFATGVSPWGIAVADVNRDGQVDIVTANYSSGNASVLLGDLPGAFAVGDTVVSFKALDQNNVEHALSDYAGKWVVIDIATVWCAPCNVMALDSQRVYDSWVGHPTVNLEYLSALVQGPSVAPSTQAHATNWGCKYKISRPVLHAQGKYPSALYSFFDGVGGEAIPTVVVVDPQGIVRYAQVGALTGQQTNDLVASLAGVASPTLAPPPALVCSPPPDPTPEGQVRAVWLPVASGTSAEVAYGGPVSTSPLSDAFDLSPTARVIPFYDFDVNPGGLTFPIVQIQASVDSLTGIEALDIAFATGDGESIPVALPYSFQFNGLSWPDGLPRVLVEPTESVLVAYYLENNDVSGPQTGFGTTLHPTVSFTGTQLSVGPFDLSAVPGMPAQPWGLFITQVNVEHANSVGIEDGAVRGGGRLVMGAPWPNPATQSTRLRWVLPVSGHADIEVIDVAGRRVRTLFGGTLEAGAQVTNWDLTDDAGHRVRNGVYFARIKAAGGEAVTRLAVMR